MSKIATGTVWLAGVWLLILAGCQPASAPPVSATLSTAATAASTSLDNLLGLMERRLSLMHDVARWKWNNKRPIADPEREMDMLAGIVAQGASRRLEADLVRAFFAAQVEAAKMVQAEDFQKWEAEKQELFSDVPDLVERQRPRIDDVNTHLLEELGRVEHYLRDMGVRNLVEGRSREIFSRSKLPDAVRRKAIEPLVADTPGRTISSKAPTAAKPR